MMFVEIIKFITKKKMQTKKALAFRGKISHEKTRHQSHVRRN